MVVCGSAVPFFSVDDLPGLSLLFHIRVVFHNCCCHGKAVAGTDEPNSWSGRQKLQSDTQRSQLSEGLQFPSRFWTQLFASRHCYNCVQLNVQANLSHEFGGLKGRSFSAAGILVVAI